MKNALLKYHVWHAHFSKYSEYIQRSLQLPEDPSAKVEYTLSCRQRKLDSQTTRLGYLIQFGREVSRLYNFMSEWFAMERTDNQGDLPR